MRLEERLRTDVRPDPEPVVPGRGRPAVALLLILAVLVLVVAGTLAVTGAGDEEGTGIRTEAGPRTTAVVLGEAAASTLPPAPVTTTISRATAARRAGTANTARNGGAPVTATVATAPTVTTAPAAATVTAPPVSTTVGLPAAPTGSQTSTASPCRNSTDPACGPFRLDPQPGADSPMTVEVTMEPAAPVAGQPVVFRFTLKDPDGVSYGSSLYGFGDSGVGDSKVEECQKFGAWDPPTPDPASATKVVEVSHTYSVASSYPARFAFDAGPFDCVDSGTGRGDRPYASSAVATLTVVVT